jgi:F-type H+-transporting ATPase subunit b
MTNRIFGLDAQLIADAVILALAVGFLFFLLSYLLFNPARELMAKRQAKIKEEMETLLYEHFGGQEQYMGFCFEYWSKKSELLSSKYGIEWRSPSLMNPRVLFD